MTKAGLVEKVQKKLAEKGVSIQKAVLRQVINAFVEAMVDALVKDGKLTLKGFGSFEVVKRKPFVARNPKTGAKVKVPASKRVRFSVSEVLKKAINQ